MSDNLSELTYLEELRRLKLRVLEACVDTEALNAELQPESLRRDRDLSELLQHLIWDLDEAHAQAERVYKHVEGALAMQGFPLDARDQHERDGY